MELLKLHYGSDCTFRVSLRVVLYSNVIVRLEYFIFRARHSLENDKFSVIFNAKND